MCSTPECTGWYVQTEDGCDSGLEKCQQVGYFNAISETSSNTKASISWLPIGKQNHVPDPKNDVLYLSETRRDHTATVKREDIDINASVATENFLLYEIGIRIAVDKAT